MRRYQHYADKSSYVKREGCSIMSIGARLKEERNRLCLNQVDFAGLCDSSARTVIQWEGDKTSPNAEALARFEEAGVDILYVVTGRRKGQRGSGLTSAEADAVVERAEALFAANDAPFAETPENAALRERLEEIALDENLVDRVRDRADMMLRIGFQDEKAETRSEERHLQRRRAYRMAETIVMDAARAAGWTPPPLLGNTLAHLANHYRVPTEILSDLINEIRKLID